MDIKDYTDSTAGGNGALPLPLFSEWSGGVDIEDFQTTFRATTNALNKALFEQFQAGGMLIKFEGEEFVTGSGWNIVDGTEDADVIKGLFEAFVTAHIKYWNSNVKAKLYFSKKVQIQEYVNEGTLVGFLPDSLPISWKTVPADYTGGSADFVAKDAIKRLKLYVEFDFNAMQNPEETYSITNEDLTLDTDTYFGEYYSCVKEYQSAVAKLLSVLGYRKSKIEKNVSIMPWGKVVEENSYPEYPTAKGGLIKSNPWITPAFPGFGKDS